MHDTHRCKRGDGAWMVEMNENGDRNGRAREGVEWRRRFCGPAAPGLWNGLQNGDAAGAECKVSALVNVFDKEDLAKFLPK